MKKEIYNIIFLWFLKLFFYFSIFSYFFKYVKIISTCSLKTLLFHFGFQITTIKYYNKFLKLVFYITIIKQCGIWFFPFQFFYSCLLPLYLILLSIFNRIRGRMLHNSYLSYLCSLDQWEISLLYLGEVFFCHVC